MRRGDAMKMASCWLVLFGVVQLWADGDVVGVLEIEIDDDAIDLQVIGDKDDAWVLETSQNLVLGTGSQR